MGFKKYKLVYPCISEGGKACINRVQNRVLFDASIFQVL
jgi:hypothetical protein